MKNSEEIAGFLSFLRDVPQRYRASMEEQRKQKDLMQDLLHHLEIDYYSYRDTAFADWELDAARRMQRAAKDSAEVLALIDQYIQQYEGEINALEKLLGDVREAEQRHENRFYVPKVRKEQGAEQWGG